jgi:thiamine biosynthesis lipoprotein
LPERSRRLSKTGAVMKETRILMGMPVTVEIIDAGATSEDLSAAFDYFGYIDKTFSTYKPDSEMMRINRGELPESAWSDDMRIVLMLAEETKQRSEGFFDIRRPAGTRGGHRPEGFEARDFIDPSGLVKGWAIFQAAKLLEERGQAAGFKNFYVDAGSDIQTKGLNAESAKWRIGIKNPFNEKEIVKVVEVSGEGVATSGTYIRGDHIYNPKTGAPANEIASLTVIGPNIYEADRFATAAFAMGRHAIHFIESLPDLEGYMIDQKGIATMSSGFEKFVTI